LFLAWIGIQQYNEVQQLSERVGTNLDHVVNQYMRRADLIPKLNRAIESFSSNEKALIDAVNKSQSQMYKVTKGASPAANVELMEAFIKNQRDIDLAIGQLIALFRNNNASASSDLYMGLMVQLEGTENRIAFARANYIETISNYNVSLKVFPMQLFSKQLGLEPKVNYFKDYVSLLNAPS
jgi:LemA protein